MESQLKLNELPLEIFTVKPQELWNYCPPLSLYHIPGEKQQPLVLSVMLHGNEDAGLLTLQKLLEKYGTNFPRQVILIIGNTLAARENLRHLDSQPDFNRVWFETGPYQEQQLAHQILDFLRQQNPLACIDVHNNTGKNPHYVCVNHKKAEFYSLASLFEGPTVFFDDPKEVLTMATGHFCPSVILECGLPGDLRGAQKAAEFIERAMNAEDFSEGKNKRYSYYEVVVKIEIPYQVSFAVDAGDEEVLLNGDLENFNFVHLDGSQKLGLLRGPAEQLLQVTDHHGQDMLEKFLDNRQQHFYFKPGYYPSMLTLNHKVIEQDCLGYLMEKRIFP